MNIDKIKRVTRNQYQQLGNTKKVYPTQKIVVNAELFLPIRTRKLTFKYTRQKNTKPRGFVSIKIWNFLSQKEDSYCNIFQKGLFLPGQISYFSFRFVREMKK